MITNATEKRRPMSSPVVVDGRPGLRKQHSLRTMTNQMAENKHHFENIDRFDFDIFKFSQEIGRLRTLPYAVLGMLDKSGINLKQASVDEERLVTFLNAIAYGYRREVQYHNDLHGADVAQAVFMFAQMGDFKNRIELTDLDYLAMLVAAACHDYDHDGMTNTYHINSTTSRALRYHDESVQENYHAAESMTLCYKDENNFLHECDYDQIKVFRKRVVGLIIATDMAKHMEDLKSFK